MRAKRRQDKTKVGELEFKHVQTLLRAIILKSRPLTYYLIQGKRSLLPSASVVFFILTAYNFTGDDNLNGPVIRLHDCKTDNNRLP